MRTKKKSVKTGAQLFLVHKSPVIFSQKIVRVMNLVKTLK